MGYFTWTVVIGTLCLSLVTAQDVCSSANRTRDLNACLTAVKAGLMEKTRFWFGDQYSVLCPSGPYTWNCVNPYYNESQSMGTRVFPDGLNLNLITKYLTVSYTSEAGSYDACGNTFTMDTWQAEITPTSDDVMYPWHLRNMPALSWDANSDDFYTLIIYDVGNFILHGVFVNIAGNETATGEVKRAYNGPKVSYNRENPYAFFLFRQQGRVNISQEWMGKINSWSMDSLFYIPEFASAYNLTGPVAVNWMVATGDEYAAQYMQNMRVLYTCPVFVSKRLDLRSRPFLPQKSELTVGVQVDFVNQPISFTVCCKETRLAREEFSLNPLGTTIYNTASVRSANNPAITLRKAGLYAFSTNFTDDMYALITVDPDVPFPTAGTEDRPILHQMIVNIRNGDISTGNVTQAYSGPSPPDDNPHYYYFLLYKQNMTLDPAEMPGYAANTCSGGLVGRCLYDINKLVQEKQLTLVGANWMTATNDDYVIYRRLNTSDPVAVNSTCFGRSEFADPCPSATSAAPALIFPQFLFLLTAFITCRFNGLL